MTGAIRIGIGGWTYEPWRGTFYPGDLKQKDELGFAAARLGAIEINATYYRLQKPASFAKWRDATPDDFAFAIKASRYCTNRRVLAETGEGVGNFFGQGIAELGDKLGPILWQFMPTKRFERDDFGAFLGLLPRKLDGRALRHAVEVRHESFCCEEFVALAREQNVAIVFADHERYPQIADVTADFVYARLQRARENVAMGYAVPQMKLWADSARFWVDGHAPDKFATICPRLPPAKVARDVWLFMINGAKVRAPAAAQALIARIG